MAEDYIIRGKRIAFAHLTKDDLQTNLEWMEDAELKHLLERKEEKLTFQKQLQWLDSLQNNPVKLVFKIIYLDKTKPIYLGNISLFDIAENHLNTELGLYIGDPQFRGMGLGKEAIELMIEYARLNLDAKICIRIKVLQENEIAYRLYRKLGFIDCKKSDFPFTCSDNIERKYLVLK